MGLDDFFRSLFGESGEESWERIRGRMFRVPNKDHVFG